jgi:hypothetical protein
LHVCLLFASPAFGVGPHLRQGGKAGGAEEPASQDGFAGNPPGLLREDDKYRLRDFLGQIRVTHLPQRRRIDEANAPRNERFSKAASELRAAYSRSSAMSSIACIHL